MSNTQFAFIKKVKVPGREAWQKSIDNLNFNIRVQIDPELEPFEDEGYSPCVWDSADDDVGFEIYYEPSEDIHDGDEEFKIIIGGNDYCISMRWGVSMKDCAAVMIASCALAKDFGAVISYGGDPPEELNKLVEQTREIIIEAEKEQSEFPESIEYMAFAQDVLQSIKGNFLSDHDFAEVKSESFRDLDIDFYDSLQAKLEVLGFVLLLDIEDKTISEQGGIRALIRTMRNPQSETLAAFYYISVLGDGFIEFESFLSDGNIVLSTTMPESEEITTWPKIHTSHYSSDVDEKEIYRAHLENVVQSCRKGSETFSLTIDSFNELAVKQNYMNQHKHDHLQKIGWVTKEYLLAQSKGDEVIADGVFEAIQKLVAQELI
ncbi:MAG: hypothetical protein ACI87H_003244 [Gammaproteobacteria bacterium]|jgi:hypothetical protein